MMRRVPALRKQASAHAEMSDRAAALRVGIRTSAAGTIADASRATSRTARASEQVFRIIFKFRGNVRRDEQLNVRSIEEDWNEEVWTYLGCAWCDRCRGAVYCER
jgi:hypothetical protein